MKNCKKIIIFRNYQLSKGNKVFILPSLLYYSDKAEFCIGLGRTALLGHGKHWKIMVLKFKIKTAK
jgi:hypothetical protein